MCYSLDTYSFYLNLASLMAEGGRERTGSPGGAGSACGDTGWQRVRGFGHSSPLTGKRAGASPSPAARKGQAVPPAPGPVRKHRGRWAPHLSPSEAGARRLPCGGQGPGCCCLPSLGPRFSQLKLRRVDLRLPPSAWDGVIAPCITRCLLCYSYCTPQIYDGF